MKEPVRRALIALSLANLCHLDLWWQILSYTRTNMFLMEMPPGPSRYMSLVLSILVEALVFFSAATLIANNKSRFAAAGRIAFFVVLLIPLENTRQVLFQLCRIFRREFLRVTAPNIAVASIVLIVSALLLYNKRLWEPRLLSIASGLLLLFSPLAFLNIGQALYRSMHYRSETFEAQRYGSPLPAENGQPRVMFVLFDEWDYRLSFEDRKPGLALPNIDRFRRGALFATDAHPPGHDTIVSVPAILTGRVVKEFSPTGVSEARVSFEGERAAVHFSDVPNLFSQAKAAGLNTAVIGWYLPYCRMFSKDLTYCDWTPLEQKYNSAGSDFWQYLANEPRSLLEFKFHSAYEIKSYSIFGQPLTTRHRVESYVRQSAKMLDKAADRNIGLLYIHSAIPHSPYFYNSKTQRFDLGSPDSSGYFENLALVDRLIGDLRSRMEQAGVWDSTTVLLTSDHCFRTSDAVDGKKDSRVPFLLKMAGANRRLELNEPFNTVLVRDMMAGIFQKRISTTEQAAEWIRGAAAAQAPTLRARTFF